MGILGLVEAYADTPDGADSETCRHNVLRAWFAPPLVEPHIACVSCGRNMEDYLSRVGKNYEYDKQHDMWVHVPKKGIQNAQDREA